MLAKTYQINNDGNSGDVDLYIVNSIFNAKSGSITSAIELVRSGGRVSDDDQPVNLTATLNHLTISGNTGSTAIQTACSAGGFE